MARSQPSSASARPIRSRYAASLTPRSWRGAPAGFVSGPRRLKIVLTPSARRTGTMCLNAGWWAGANMKPRPHSSRQRATASGSRSMRAPRASSTSALPQREVAERLPCLATATPAPATTKVAVVEMLKVERPPPVPQVSMNGPAGGVTRWARARMVDARPASSAAVSPLARRATRKPAVCASPASPDMIASSAPAAPSRPRSSPASRRSMASEITSEGIGGGARPRGRGSSRAAPSPSR